MYSTEDYVTYYTNREQQQSGSGTALTVANKICDVVKYLTPEEKKSDDQKPVGSGMNTEQSHATIRGKKRPKKKQQNDGINKRQKMKRDHNSSRSRCDNNSDPVCSLIKRFEKLTL